MTDTINIATLLAPERLRGTVVSALVDGRTFQRFARGDDQPEDLAVDLLRKHDTGAVRNSVLAGVRDVWLVLQEALVQPDCDPDAPARKGSLPLGEIVSHFGALLNRAAPKELEALPYSLLEIVLHPDADRVLYGPLVRAALAYAHSERRAPFWETQAAEELVPGWAFKALAQINAEHPRILRLLVLCWTKALAKQTTADPVVITNEIASKRKDPAAFRRELWRSVVVSARRLDQYETFTSKWEGVAMHSTEKHALHSEPIIERTSASRIATWVQRKKSLQRNAFLKHVHTFYGGGYPVSLPSSKEPLTIEVQYLGGKFVTRKADQIELHLGAAPLSANEIQQKVYDEIYVVQAKEQVVEHLMLPESSTLSDFATSHMRTARTVEVGDEPGEHAGKWCQTLKVDSDINDTPFQHAVNLAMRKAEQLLQQTFVDMAKRSDEDAVLLKEALDAGSVS